MLVIMIFCSLFSFSSFATEKIFAFASYDEAKEAKNYLKFEGESTKLGLVTTDFDGYVKKFKIDYQLTKLKMEKLKVIIEAKSIDTDSGSRNEKMYELCLETKKYPQISFELSKALDMQEGKQQVVGILKVRENQVEVPIELEIKKSESGYRVEGETHFSLKELKIADPSISIASVNDKFDIDFDVNLDAN
ncbi:MAG: YceI family protein [Bacteriovoracaceae bacterium]|nr:YceI family protein [Bacteriovoracaceae bacterium]